MDHRETRLLSLPEAAVRLGISHWTVRKWATTGQIDSVVLGRRRLIPEDAINKMIKKNYVAATPEGRNPAKTAHGEE